MGAGSTIIVNARLGAVGTLFASCKFMWNKVSVEHGGYVALSGCEFRNADIGLEFSEGYEYSKTYLIGCKFINNRIGIQVGNERMGNPIVFRPYIFSGNTFSGGPPPIGYAYTGINFINCSNGLLRRPVISDFQYGIRMKNSMVTIASAAITRSVRTLGDGGWAVVSENSKLTMLSCTLANSSIGGVQSSGTLGLDIRNCAFTNVTSYGIHSTRNNEPANVWITNNTFISERLAYLTSAIEHERTPNSDPALKTNRITGNTIDLRNSYISTANIIKISTPKGGKDDFPVWNNTILTSDYGSLSAWGIFVKGTSDGMAVNKNTIKWSNVADGPDHNMIGIAIEFLKGTRHSVDSNIVTAGLSSNFYDYSMLCGIHLVASPNLHVCSNEVDSTYRGFHFGSDLRFCNFARNTIGRHTYGIECVRGNNQAPTNLGNQDWHENLWSTNSSNYRNGAKYSDGGAPFVFRVDATNAGHMPPKPDPLSWFLDIPIQMSTSNCVNSMPLENNSTGEVAEQIINGAYIGLSESDHWDTKRMILCDIHRSGQYLQSGTVYYDFYHLNTGSSEGKYALAERMIEQAFEFPTDWMHLWDSLNNKIKVLDVTLLQLDSIALLDTVHVSQSLLALKDSLINQILPLHSQMAALSFQCRNFSELALQQAQAFCNQLPVSKVYEANLQTVLLAKIKQARCIDFTENDYMQLRPIAQQCEAKGGRAVHFAFDFLPHSESVIYQSEKYQPADCAFTRGPGVEDRSAFTSSFVNLFPNPASDILHINWADANLRYWTITDISGHIYLEGTHNGTNLTIEATKLPEGLFIFRALVKDGSSTLEKFSIIR